jgi:hypothetical protein
MSPLLEAWSDPRFWQKALLLIMGAVLTGILIPMIKWVLDDSSFRRQKKFEAALARQREAIKAQTDLLTTLADLLWAYNLLALEVSYYHILGTKKQADHVGDKFDRDSWILIKKIRSAIGAARWFTPDQTYAILTGFYEGWIMELDKRVTAMLNSQQLSKDEWLAHHNVTYNDAARRTDELLATLARTYGIRLEQLAPSGAA